MSDHVYQGIHSGVSTGTLNQPSIDISINTWWTFHFSQTQSTLNQCLDRHSLTVGRKLVECQPVQRYRNWSTLNGMSAKISWLSTKMLIKCWSSVNWGAGRGSMEGRLRVLIKGIVQHPTVDAFSAHDPLCLINAILSLPILLRWFHSIALHIPTAHDFHVISAHVRLVHVQNVRDFPRTMLDSKINPPFLLNEHGDPHFLFHNFSENNILNNWE